MLVFLDCWSSKTIWVGVISVTNLHKNADPAGFLSFLLILLARPSVSVFVACQCLSFIFTLSPIVVTSYNKSTRFAQCKRSCRSISVFVLLLSWSVFYLPHPTPGTRPRSQSSGLLLFFIAFLRLPSILLFRLSAACSSFITVCSHPTH